jgi:glutamine amidotransferase
VVDLTEAVIVDYGIGNLFSLRLALQNVGFDATVSSSKEKLQNAELMVLPGVGNFSVASMNLEPLRETILERVADGVPILGICLGMQLIFSRSQEGEGRGLDILAGSSIRLPNHVKTPHMGWNTLNIVRQSRLLEGVENESYVYFVHSYYPDPAAEDVKVAETVYGTTFTSVVELRNIFGTQFHPEKSGLTGSRILRNIFEKTKDETR